MNENTILSLVNRLEKYWRESDVAESFIKLLLSNPKYKPFFSQLNLDGLFTVAMLINDKKKGMDINEEYGKIKTSLFSFSIILVREFEPDVDCETCDGSGNLECGDCRGRGYVDCEVCGGNGDIECQYCYGSGYSDEEDEDGNLIDCSHCDGNGTVDCNDCDGGNAECSTCRGSGEEECYNCDGQAYVSAMDKLEAEQYYYVSYDLRIKDLLDLKSEYSEISQSLENLILDSPRTFLVNVQTGIMDSFDGFAVNTFFFGEMSEDDLMLKSMSRRGEIKIDVYNLMDYVD
jgi:hypothetical protein